MSFVKPKGGLSSLPKEGGTTIKYNGGVTSADGSKGSFLKPQNLVQSFQKIYQAGSHHVHVKTPRDRMIVQGVLVGSLVGIAISFAGLYKLAMPKK